MSKRVICVDDLYDYTGFLVKGKTYEVVASHPDDTYVLAGSSINWMSDRFMEVPGSIPLQAESPFILPTDSEARKQIPLYSGVLAYFPLALAAVARLSKRGNDKHNPGQPLHWAREKSADHADCIARHLIDVETLDPATGEYEDATALAWRALAKLQELEEKRLNKPPSRGSQCPTSGS